MSARSWIGWSLATLVIAVLAHMASMHFAPRFIMHVAMSRMGAANTIHHQPRVTAASRGVVRPSPDLLYAACPFDLAHGPLLVTAAVPPNTYWSVSVFDADTNNIFALNDRQTENEVQLVIVHNSWHDTWLIGHLNSQVKRSDAAPISQPHFVASSTSRGLVLFRTLIPSAKDFAKIDAARRKANCRLLGKP